MKEIIITSSVLILCIMLMRFFLKGKISARLQYALWILVALRLIIPSSAQIHMTVGSIEEFRIMDLVEVLEERFGDVTGQLEKPVQFSMSLDSPLAGQAVKFMLGEDLDLPDPADGPTSVFIAGRIGPSWLDILRGIWIGGMVVVALWMVITNIVFSRRLYKGRKEYELPEELKEMYFTEASAKVNRKHAVNARGIKFYTAEHLTSSCLYGIPGREAVYLMPDIVEDQNKLRHVVTHEICHRKHGDSLWSILRSVLVCIYWMNPLVWTAAVLSKRDCELACDEEALLILGEEERISYGETLLSIITGKSRLSDIACTATTMTGGGRSVKERIQFIAEKPKVLGVAVAAALMLIMVALILVFTKNPLFNGDTWAEGELTVISGDMQVRLPETIAGISGYQAKDSDGIIIYQMASGDEVGRFCTLSFGETVTLIEEGREVTPLGNYGQNMFLRQYMDMLNGDGSVGNISHTYTAPDVTNHNYSTYDSTAVDGVPGTDVNVESTYIFEENDFMSSGDVEQIPIEESADYLPNEAIEEGSSIYLPDEEIAEDSQVYLPDEAIAEDLQEYLPNEEIVEGLKVHFTDYTEPDVTKHTFTAYDSAAVDGVSGTDTNFSGEEIGKEPQANLPDEDIREGSSYLPDEEIEEESQDYLPNEQIITVRIPEGGASDQCYVYVKADYTGVRDKYLEELEYINRELEAVTDQVIVLSINREIRQELFTLLAENRTQYLGDASKVSALVNALPQPEGLVYKDITLHTTQEESLSLDINYQLSANGAADVDSDMMLFNAVMLFATIRNLDECNFVMEYSNSSGYVTASYSGLEDADVINHYETESKTYNGAELKEEFGTLWSDEADESGDYVGWLNNLYTRVSEQLKDL